jgi:hypothetical protein
VSVSRKLTEHWLWEDRPFTRGQAWIDLILLVNHEDNEFLHGNQITIVKRGSRITSIKKLADRWGWSRKKVFDFLNVLEKEQMLVKNSNTKETLVTIVKYEDYQNSRNTKETPKKHQRNTEETPKSTNNNENNDNNILPKGNKQFVSDQLLNQAILEFIEFRKKIKSQMTDRAVELMIKELNKLSPDTLTQIAILNQSIMNGWKGVFELKQDRTQPQAPKPTNKFNNHSQRTYTAEDYAEIERASRNRL